MPTPRKQPTAAPPASRMFKRRVQIASASFIVRMPGPLGALVEQTLDAAKGDEIEVDAAEQMRLDSLGALAPVGATREDVQEAFDARVESYRSVRRGIAGIV